jgi:hypothetical protein
LNAALGFHQLTFDPSGVGRVFGGAVLGKQVLDTTLAPNRGDEMHIKVERFLTLTAMLASTQVGLVGCGDDGNGTEPGDDAGRSDVTTGQDGSSDGGATSADGGTKGDTGELNATLDTPRADGGANDAAVTADADVVDGSSAIDAGFGEATARPDAGGETPWSDASAESWPDAGGETPWSDTSAESWPDAGGEGGEACYDGDFADESAVDACTTTFGSCQYGYAITTCSAIVTDYRAGIAETFWDCYNDAAVEDPCSEDANYTATSCHSFAMENAVLCPETITECETVVANCGAVTVEYCESAFALYNSGRRGESLDCLEAKLANQAGPDYEGCDYDFSVCAYSPSVE